MYCFVMKPKLHTLEEIHKDLRIGSLVKDVKLVRLDQAVRWSYDFLTIHYSLDGSSFDGYLATSNFKNSVFFQLKHFDEIKFWLRIPSHDFVTDQQASLMYQIQKLNRYTSIHKQTRDEELVALKQALTASIEQYKIL